MFKRMEIIEFLDEVGDNIVSRVPETGSGEFRLGSQLVVRENQEAVFFRDGKAMDTFGPGRHTLTTENVPILAGLADMAFEGEGSPFRAEVYFVNKKTFTEMKWGTKEPIIFRDKELQMVRLRAFGRFSMRVAQSQLFINKLVGTEGKFTADEIEGYLKDVITSRLADLLGETLESIFDLPQYYDEIATLVKTRLGDDFEKYGINLVDFYVNAITPPEEVQKRIDERSAMSAMGNLDDYMRFKTATAMGDAAQSEGGGGAAGAGVGMGAGLGMGMTMANMMGQTMSRSQQGGGGGGGATQTGGPPMVTCPSCGKQVPQSKFCSECGKPLQKACPNCNEPVGPDAKFCPNCGQKLGVATCQKCGAEIAPGTKFCPECGAEQE